MGWKCAQYEMKGVPLRLELGPRDIEAGQCVLVRRNDGEKTVVSLENLEAAVAEQLELVQAGMTQSMSRVAHCIDNGPMEGFWGILKRERYYGRRFTSKHELVQMIQQYIRYYNTRRVQRNLGVLTPMEKHALCLAA